MSKYQGKKMFVVRHEPTFGEITVEIDFDKTNTMSNNEVPMLVTIQAMVLFWTNGEELIEYYGGDVVKAFLKNLCHRCLCLQLEYYRNTIGIIELFKNQEGYVPMDGSMGIRLVSVSEMELLESEDYDITELSHE